MKNLVGNLVLGVMGAIAVIGLVTIVVSMVIGQMDYHQMNYISLSGE